MLSGAAFRRRRPRRSARRRLRRAQHLPRAAAAPAARRGSRQSRAARSGRRVPRADPRDQRRPLRRAGGSPALRRAHLHPPQDHAGAGGPAIELQRRALPEIRRRRWRRLFADLPEALQASGELADRLDLHDGGSRLSLSRISGPGGEIDGVVPAQDHAGRRARSLPADRAAPRRGRSSASWT